MAIAVAVTRRYSFGDRYLVTGTYTLSGGDTGGTITVPGLSVVEDVWFRPKAAAGVALAPVSNTAMPSTSNAFLVATNANETGVFHAIGY